jgi:putative ABC transport system permease protein
MLFQDIRYGLRTLVKQPTFTAAAVLTLALGIGANTAMFSTINAVLLRQLPYENPDRLVTVWQTNPQKGIDQTTVSAPTFAHWRDENNVFEQLAVYDIDSLVLSGSGEPERLPSAQVSPNFFSLLGVQTVAGRAFTPEENQPGRNRVVILSHGLWQRRFNADPGVVGRTLTLTNAAYTVVGVLPPDFRFIDKADLWSPLPSDDERQNCGSCHFFTVVGRLKQGVTPVQAQAEMAVLSSRLQQQEATGVKVIPLRDYLVAGVRSSLLILLGAVVFVLLIACANVSNLLLARAGMRQKEFSVRTALGATRRRLARQLLTESVMLSLLGGGLGLILAYWFVGAITALLPEGMLRDEIVLDSKVLGFTLLLSLLTGIAFGLIPAVKASKAEFNELLKDSMRGSTGGVRHARTRRLLIISEVALSVMLLVGAGLMIKSFLLLQKTSPGFNPDNLLTARVFLNATNYPAPHQKAAFFQRVLQEVGTIPGVKSAGAVTSLPLGGSSMSFRFAVEGEAAPAPGEQRQAQYRAVSPNYFHTMGIPLTGGRDFTESDAADAPGVVIINETMARRLFPDGGALGKRLTITYGKPTPRVVVGVVGDVKHLRLDEGPKPEMYVPSSQNPWPFMTLVMRTTVPPSSIVQSVRERVWSVDKNQPVDKILTADQILYEAVAQPRLYALLLGVFAAVAFILSAVGIYGVMSYLVSQRTHEIGVRMALGARPGDILKLVVRQGMTNVVIGVACGLILSLIVTRVLSSLLYGISATDPNTFIGVPLLLALVALLACLLPARRATKIDPTIALRYE